jgi:hypothetical protein
MTSPRKPDPKQHGRKTENKVPLSLVLSDPAKNMLLGFLKHFDDTGIAPAAPLTDDQQLALNEAAAKRALQLTLAEPDRHKQVSEKLKTEGWEEAAWFSVYHQQNRSLALRPSQNPPVALECDWESFDGILANPNHADYPTAALTMLLIKHGVSVFSPTPITDLEEAIAAKRGRLQALKDAQNDRGPRQTR